MNISGIRSQAEIARKMADKAKDKRPQYAVVTGVDGVRIDVRVGQSKVAIKNVEVIGDTSAVAVGDTVQIAWWSQDRPVAIAGVQVSATNDRLAALEDRVSSIPTSRPISTPNPVGGIADWQILRFSGGALASVHDPSVEGMEDALTVSASGDLILLPSIELEMDFTIPEGVTVTGLSRSTSLVLGTVTLSTRSVLEKIRVIDTSSDETEAIALIASDTSTVRDCDAWACACGSGGATGMRVDGGQPSVYASFISGEGTPGYGIALAAGSVKLFETIVYGTTDQFDGTDVYVHGTTLGSTACVCSLESGVLPSTFLSGNASAGSVLPAHIEHPSLENPASLTQYFSHDLGNSSGYSGLAVYLTKVFFASSDGLVYRVNLNGTSSAVDRSIDLAGYGVQLAALDENIAYVVFQRDSDGKIVLSKLDFTNSPVVETVLEEYTEEFVWAGHNRGYWESYWIALVKPNGVPHVIATQVWWSDDDQGDAVRLLVHNTATEVTTFDFYEPVAPGNTTTIYFVGEPVCFSDKIVYTVSVSGYIGDNECLIPAYVINFSDWSVDKIDNFNTDPAWDIYSSGACRIGNIYYCFVWQRDPGSATEHGVMKIDFDDVTPNYALEQATAYMGTVYQSANATGYSVEWEYDPDHLTLRGLPVMTTIGAMDNNNALCVDELKAYQHSDSLGTLNGYLLADGTESGVTLSPAPTYALSSLQSLRSIAVCSGMYFFILQSFQAGAPNQYSRELFIYGP